MSIFTLRKSLLEFIFIKYLYLFIKFIACHIAVIQTFHFLASGSVRPQ